ncbi:NBS-LRR type disease resistance protein [Medicago truncatula]|uniref:NBS-LRR type disease resistance protein n=1 Tax=Medicago truncatula TaxID=3880 RepID=G7KYB9_MEDTR|nr:NBS-LRR type disease resistance protein [Medicago truncatula]
MKPNPNPWACISDDFNINQIIINIINSASASTFAPASVPPSVSLAHQENINNFDIEQLQSHDIWNDDRAKWIELIDLIKVGAAGSKIIVTTRSNSFASMMGTIPSYVLEGEVVKYPDLVHIGKEIVKKCAGVPLSVRTLRSSLFSKYDLNKWIFVRDSEIWNLEQKKDDILPALKLSYDQMPSYLRQCFAFFSLYPKDYAFSSDNICSLWMAFGIVQSRIGIEQLKDIAREYIEELNSRLFLQDFEHFGYCFMFKVHDLIHDLPLYVAKEEFVAVDSHTRNIPEHTRHVTVVENNSLDIGFFPKSKSLRTILFPMKGVGLDSQTLLNTWISRYKYLRYLGLRDSSFDTLPNSIAKLEHLRVLNLINNRKIRRLPQSILLSFCDCENMKFLFSQAQELNSLEKLTILSCGSLESLPYLFIFPKLQDLIISDCQMINLSLYNKRPIQRLMMKHL